MYDTVRDRLIHLHHCRGAGWKTIHDLLEVDPTLSAPFSLPPAVLRSLVPLSDAQWAAFFHDLHSIDVKNVVKTYKERGIRIITMFDLDYPPLLKHIYDPPWVLYAKGNIALLQETKLISIVGTRRPTKEGIEALKKLVPPLVAAGWTIVSGLAFGIDVCAHQLAVSYGGTTIAVIAGGLDHIYPKEHRSFAQQLMNEQLVVAEHPPATKPQAWQFPARNRIISGLSLGTLVVQAKVKSGSLITASYALEQGREVFAVPGSINLAEAAGPNTLIQHGAKLVQEAADIIAEFPYV
ncbi:MULTISPECIES: DNA-processing protein DprA [Geobacillus]|jgi:DNA processing protein|uniref:DNA-processing protein DprA n=1 Tax=Geobacillus thermodenitrificans TaxID=33940 RepID=A0ABY9QGP4_GEOTD|nr:MULTISPECIES: DNA-processing protein DprA [Geobacillus]ARP42197.1 Protein smf [Geobacillus thermodenitrificans]KQB93834.1 Protein smf [Geobacillus sp. PA-3]MEC5188568.1 DNA processing protein [Geobacillus thermodenitrificans]MED0663674.1 DNA-protecting protein DprA [Geobacillus thermodenitrificans]MED4917167.1 DNA-processing protein DprA [Geobacillus thermodenitrificans]